MKAPTANALLTAMHALNPHHVSLENESHKHAGHFEGKESHFKLVIVSDAFVGKRLVARHQAVYALANDLLTANGGTIHALAIHAYTRQEWQTLGQTLGQAPDSPNCAGRH